MSLIIVKLSFTENLTQLQQTATGKFYIEKGH